MMGVPIKIIHLITPLDLMILQFFLSFFNADLETSLKESCKQGLSMEALI
jgi:hypothetical protein